MAQNIIILLTEGDHDAAFIYRILKANGFPKFSKKIKDFPPPLNELFAKDILNVSIEEVNIQQAKSRFLPTNIMQKDKNLILIYTIGGDSKSEIRIKLISVFSDLLSNDKDQIQVIKDSEISFLYFFDSDNKGVSKRLNEINAELKVVYKSVFSLGFTKNTEIIEINEIKFGAYIFTEKGKDVGKLEDVLVPLMEKDNEDIFKAADNYLSIHGNTNLFKNKIQYRADKSIHKVYDDVFHYKKSLIGTVGQLQKSGKSNTVCISDAEYLNEVKIKASSACVDIFAFICKVII